MKFGSGGSCCAGKLIDRVFMGAIGRVGIDAVASSLVIGCGADSHLVVDVPGSV